MKYNDKYFSKEAVLQYRGICALIILLYHLGWTLDFEVYRPFAHGDYVTGLFFFFSGYGLMKRHMNDKFYSVSFLKKRVLPIVFVYAIMNVICWGDYLCQGIVYTPRILVEQFYYYGNLLVPYSWFIVSIVYFYFMFYILIKLFREKHLCILMGELFSVLIYACVIYCLNWGMHWYTTCILFVLGALWACKEQVWMKKIVKYFLFEIIFILLCFCILVNLRNSVSTGLNHIIITIFVNMFFCILFILITFVVKIDVPFFKFVGKNSLEIYLVHGFIIRLLVRTSLKQNIILSYIFVILLSIVFAVILNKVKKVFECKIINAN